MASMITNALVTTETHLTNGGIYQHNIHPPNGIPPFNQPIQSFGWPILDFMNVHATNMVSTNCYVICIGGNVQVVLWEVAIPKLY
jgi:hypothetical protein